MHKFFNAAAYYLQPKILGIFLLGFSSGLPFLLTLATLHIWLAEVGVSKSAIGLFVLVTIPYSLKFLWAPFVDRVALPFFSDLFGHLKGWLIFSQLSLMVSLYLLGKTNPEVSLSVTALAAFFVSFFSATQDIIVESYRVRRLTPLETGYGAGATNLGYRLGMWASGAGALYAAASFSWATSYGFMAMLMLVGLVTTCLSDEPHRAEEDIQISKTSGHSFFDRYRDILIPSVRSLLKKNTIQDLILFILFYKLIDTAINVMATPFLIEIGFSKIQIADVGKSFGIGAMIAGGLIGGALLSTRPLRMTLKIGLSLQILSALLFYLQVNVGANIYLLFATVGIENLCNGIGAAAFITLLSHAARGPNSAMHFALLTSFASFARVLFSYLSGSLADWLSWNDYYLLISLMCLPGLFIITRDRRRAFSPSYETHRY